MITPEKISSRIEKDIEVLTEMAVMMPTYLTSAVTYYPLSNASIKMSLGNYLMQQERLLALREVLSATDQDRLDTAVSQFQEAVSEHVVRVEQKGNDETGIRLRQWDTAVTELQEKPEESVPYYATVVENRVMLAALIAYLQREPYRFDDQLLADTLAVDEKLATIWNGGEFILPEVWQGVYPINTHWWLYGKPTANKSAY